MKPARFLLSAAAVGAIGLVGFITAGVVREARDPAGAELRARIPSIEPERPAGSPFSADFHQSKARLVNDLARRSHWDDDGTDFFIEIVGSGWPDVPRPEGGSELEGWLLLDTALAVVADRHRVGAETDPAALDAFIATVMDLIDHPQAYARRRGVTAGSNAGLLERPEFRRLVETMAEADPDEQVRHSARVKLDQAAGIPTDSDDCPTCPKGGQP